MNDYKKSKVRQNSVNFIDNAFLESLGNKPREAANLEELHPLMTSLYQSSHARASREREATLTTAEKFRGNQKM